MPELPEVETIARGLAKRVTGDLVESVWLGQKPEPLKSPAAEIAATLEQSRIATVRRVGKHIVFDLERSAGRVGRTLLSAKGKQTKPARPGSRVKRSLDSSTMHAEADKSVRPTHAVPTNAQWIVHLGMTGSLRICESRDEVLKHTHAILKLASGRELRFIDPRRFGRLSRAHENGKNDASRRGIGSQRRAQQSGVQSSSRKLARACVPGPVQRRGASSITEMHSQKGG